MALPQERRGSPLHRVLETRESYGEIIDPGQLGDLGESLSKQVTDTL
jgi:hypothetical protein